MVSNPSVTVISPLTDLATAVIASSTAPLVLLDREFVVVTASDSFCQTFGINYAEIVGRPVFDLGEGEWNEARLRSLLVATRDGAAKIDAYEIDLVRPHQDALRLVLSAKLLAYDDPAKVRLLLSATDVTAARKSERVKDDLLREKALMLEEIQHRVANSLQIIASVLMQSARNVQSEELRGHLKDAHSRVMSIAALQRQLAVSKVGDVPLRMYFTQLCASIAASMIGDKNRLSIGVTGDESVGTAAGSVSLGLIITELVINSLKHAFPDQAHGHIAVDYRSQGASWTLSVDDDGIGMPSHARDARPGLGTTIVSALVKQLNAAIEVTDRKPGTMIRVRHTPATIRAAEAAPVLRAV